MTMGLISAVEPVRGSGYFNGDSHKGSGGGWWWCHDNNRVSGRKVGGIKLERGGREVLVLTDNYGCSSPPSVPLYYTDHVSGGGVARCSTPKFMKSVVQFLCSSCSGQHVSVTCVKKKNRKLNCLHQVRNKVYSAFLVVIS